MFIIISPWPEDAIDCKMYLIFVALRKIMTQCFVIT